MSAAFTDEALQPKSSAEAEKDPANHAGKLSACTGEVAGKIAESDAEWNRMDS